MRKDLHQELSLEILHAMVKYYFAFEPNLGLSNVVIMISVVE